MTQRAEHSTPHAGQALPTPPSRTETSRTETHARSVITRDTERLLRGDLERLRERLDIEFAARLRDARASGDAASGDDRLQIKEEELVLRSEIARIERLLASARIVEVHDHPEGVIGIGSTFQVQDPASGKVDRHMLVGDFERGSRHGELKPISASSPIGRALMSLMPGDEAEIHLPKGRRRTLRVIAVSRSPSL